MHFTVSSVTKLVTAEWGSVKFFVPNFAEVGEKMHKLRVEIFVGLQIQHDSQCADFYENRD